MSVRLGLALVLACAGASCVHRGGIDSGVPIRTFRLDPGTGGEVRARVVLDDDFALPGVPVELTGHSVASRVAPTANDGVAAFVDVPAGVYQVEARLSGFLDARRPVIVIEPGVRTEIELRLDPPVAEAIILDCRLPVGISDGPAAQTTIVPDVDLAHLPIRRRLDAILGLAPGVHR